MNRKLMACGLVCILALLAFSIPAAAQTANSAAKSALAVPISTSFAPSTTTTGPLSSLGTGNFTGTFNIQKFVNQNGALNAVGTVVGTLTSTTGQVTNLVVNNVAVPVTQATGSCSILSLTLGPLHLDVLGLVVDLNQINLNITAQSGPGNLLGNLLCDVANLLNAGSPLTSITNLLNQILGVLGL